MMARDWWAWAARGCEALVAATILLLLLQLHSGILQTALTFVGARTDVPLILTVSNDQCSESAELAPPAWSAARRSIVTVAGCDNRVQVTTTAPVGQEFTLLVNDQPLSSRATRSSLMRFDEVRLRPGVNRLVVADLQAQLEFPHPASLGRFDESEKDHFRGVFSWGGYRMPVVQPSYLVRVKLDPKKADARRQRQPVQAITPRWLGPYRDNRGDAKYLVQGLPGAAVGTMPADASSMRNEIQADGFVFAYARPRDGQDSPQSFGELPVRRELTIRRDRDGRSQLTLEACLPPDHPFIDWARQGTILAPEFITRLTGYYVSDRIKLSDDRWRTQRWAEIGATIGNCTNLTARYSSSGPLVDTSSHTFLQSPGDRLVVEAELANALGPTQPADYKDGSYLVWRGRNGPGEEQAPRFINFPNRPPDSGSRSQSGAGGETEGQARSSAAPRFLDHWRNLSDALPNMLQAMLWSLVAILPVALIYWALGQHRERSPDRERIDAIRIGLVALLAFMGALALHPVLNEFSRIVVDLLGLWSLIIDDGRADRFYTIQFAPIAFAVVIIVGSLLRSKDRFRPSRTRWWTRALLAIISVILVVIAVRVAMLEHWIIGGDASSQDRAPTEYLLLREISGIDAGLLLGVLVLVWCAIGFFLFAVPVYWLARSVLRRGSLAKPALSAAVLLFFLPFLTPGAEAARIGIAVLVGAYQQFGPGPAFLSGLAWITAIAGLVLMVLFILLGFREIAALMLPPAIEERFRFWSRTSILAVMAILIVGPATDAVAGNANVRVYQFMTIFHAYGGLLALLAPLEAARIIDDSRRRSGLATNFRIDPTILLLLTVAFAGYLSLWVREPIGAPILIAIGWLVFAYVVIGPPPDAHGIEEPDLAKRILTFRAEMRLLEARRKMYEKEFSEGKIDALALNNRRAEIENEVAKVRAALGIPVEEAKRRLFAFGCERSPLRNAILGATVGLFCAALLQIIQPINFQLTSGKDAPAWLNLVQTFAVDPNFRPAASAENVSRLLAVVSELLNAVTIWVFIGFMFGYLFHRIRGDDGFSKAMTFGAGIAATFIVNQVMVARGAGVPLTSLARLVPIFVFLIFLGSLVFDGRSVRQQGVALAKLPDLYGVQTSIGYLSFAGAIAGVAPLLQFLDWMFPR